MNKVSVITIRKQVSIINVDKKLITCQIAVPNDKEFFKISELSSIFKQYKDNEVFLQLFQGNELPNMLGKQILYSSNKEDEYICQGVYAELEKDFKIPIVNGKIDLKLRNGICLKTKIPIVKNIKKAYRNHERLIGESIRLVANKLKQTRKKEFKTKEKPFEKYDPENVPNKTLEEYKRQIIKGIIIENLRWVY